MEGDQKDEEVKAFVESVENIHNIVGQADKFLEIAIKADRNWFFGALIKMFSRKSKQE